MSITKTTIDLSYNCQSRFEYDGSGNVIYAGYSAPAMSESSIDSNSDPAGWLLKRYTYDGNNKCTAIDIAYGNWTNRVYGGYTSAVLLTDESDVLLETENDLIIAAE